MLSEELSPVQDSHVGRASGILCRTQGSPAKHPPDWLQRRFDISAGPLNLAWIYPKFAAEIKDLFRSEPLAQRAHMRICLAEAFVVEFRYSPPRIASLNPYEAPAARVGFAAE